MTWGDALFADIEYCVIVALIWRYHRGAVPESTANLRKLSLAAFLTLLILTLTRKCPSWLLTLFGVAPMPMVVMGRVPQILCNFRNKSAGQLSLPSLVMQCGGNFARIISTLCLVPDALVLASHSIAFLFNLAPLLQLVYYDVYKAPKKVE
ncbi:putative mannose-P-dolichol utilization defect protein 1 [Gregarina niphandrodes]|uniref:Mannose-P-dolichol utilization defect protein 1 n=1 Tax=Gregarina niphandrodes TaxID=110365 RepID=A0A023BAB6_GRENI|nr:putative mannose-P-dolichol utilization defect protein 1 [Gregarina niphandrodes]EZG78175.1 putative mannose-P-dolichol utilization defect protein 1 [Gregarina niphandrodes]|eukprot:XP_011129429.1 putative mannose-P-dolichol utilization defect protein 1 [Gregarina niphandrodes]